MNAGALKTVAVCGKGVLACSSLDYLAALRDAMALPLRLVAVPVCKDGGRDTWEPSLRARAVSLGVELFADAGSVGLAPGDLLLSLQYDRIIRMAELGGAAAYNLHFSDLPRYRGCYTSVWPIRNGETRAGVSLHVLTAGIDDGPVVDQSLFPLTEYMTSYGLYQRYHLEGYELIKRNFPRLFAGPVPGIAQAAGEGSYYPRNSVDYRDLEVSGLAGLDARSFAAHVRSLVFDPLQYPAYEGHRVGMAEVMRWPAPGEGKSPRASGDGLLVRCAEGWVRLVFVSE